MSHAASATFTPDLIDNGSAFRAICTLPNAAKVIVVLRFMETTFTAGRPVNTYRARVTSAGSPVLNAMIDFPIVAAPQSPVGLNRFLAPTAFALDAARQLVEGVLSPASAFHRLALTAAAAVVPRAAAGTSIAIAV